MTTTIVWIVGIVIVVVTVFSKEGREALGKGISGAGGWASKMFADGKGVVPIILAIVFLMLVMGVTTAAKNPVFAEWWFGGIGPGHATVAAKEFDETNRELIFHPAIDPLKDYAGSEAVDHSAGPDGVNNPLIRAQADLILTRYQVEATDSRAVLNEKDAESQCALPVEARFGVWNDGNPATTDPNPCDYINKIAEENLDDFRTKVPEAGQGAGQAVGNFFKQIAVSLNSVVLLNLMGQQITLLAFLVVIGGISIGLAFIVRAGK